MASLVLWGAVLALISGIIYALSRQAKRIGEYEKTIKLHEDKEQGIKDVKNARLKISRNNRYAGELRDKYRR